MKVSVIIVTYNSGQYIPKFIESLKNQTVSEQLEIIIIDNGSTDQSVRLCRESSAAWNNPLMIEELQKNWGYTFSTNAGTDRATGEFLFVLNADTWLEPDCIEQLIRALKTTKADAASSQVASLSSTKTIPQPLHFDVFGRPTWVEDDPTGNAKPVLWPRCFMFGGPGFMIRREVWKKIGGFDTKHFMYAEDDDISWKLWLAGHQAIHVRNAILHHRNPMEDGSWEISTNTRYFVNRNSLMVIAKNAQHILLLCIPLQILMLLAEALLFLITTRNWKFVWHSYIKAIIDFFKMWPHVLEMRRFNRQIRRRSDWEMARLFLRFRINRWDMIKAFFLKGKRPVVKQTKKTT